EIKDLLKDRSFYEGLKKLRELLQPVDCSIRQSEGKRASLCDVSERWDKIWSSEPMIVTSVNLKESARVSATFQGIGQDLDDSAVHAALVESRTQAVDCKLVRQWTANSSKSCPTLWNVADTRALSFRLADVIRALGT
ncbi:hypothetical protein E4U39_000324, partial [Claviceps sp. Clav50 group G5]